MEAAFVQQLPPQTLTFPSLRKSCGHTPLSPFTPLPYGRRLATPYLELSQRWQLCRSHAESDFVQPARPKPIFRNASCHAAAGGVTLVQEETPTLRATDLDREIKRLRLLREHLRTATSFEEKHHILESDLAVRRVWTGLRDLGGVGDASGQYLLDCLIAAGQGHLLESVSLLKREPVHSNGTLENGIHHPDMHSDRAPYLDAFHMLADIVRQLEGEEEEVSPSPAALLAPPLNAHHWEQRLANGREASDSVRTALANLTDMLGRLEKFYDSIGGVIGYQLAALELIRASEEREESIEKMESSLGGDSDEHLSETALWDGSELLPDETAEMNYHKPVGPDLAADPEFAQRAAAWGIEVGVVS